MVHGSVRLALSFLMLASPAIFGGCGWHEDGAEAAVLSSDLSGKLIITGSSTVAPLIAEVAERFETEHPDVRVDVQSGGSSRGITDVRNGVADLGIISRDLKRGESDLVAHPVASDGVCLILHRDNPVDRLTDQQIVAIFTGKIENWREVGGSNESITVVNKSEGRATLDVFLDYFHLDNREIRPDVVVGENQQAIKTVTGNPSATAYVSIGSAESDLNQGVPLKLLSIGGVDATTANVANGSFPLSRPLSLVSTQEIGELASRFIEFAQSNRVHDLVTAQFFVPIRR